MGRVIATIYGGFLLLLGGALQFALPIAGLILNVGGAAKVPGSENTYRGEWAQNFFEAAQQYHSWMQQWGPWLFISFGIVLLVVAFFWKALDESWKNRFGLELKLEFEDWVNFPHYETEPYIVRRCYYDQNDPKQRITHSNFCVGVLNDTNNKTIEGVQVKVAYLHVAGAAKNFDHALHTKSNLSKTDINPKTSEYFQLGIVLEESGQMSTNISARDSNLFEDLRKQANSFAMQLLISARDDSTGAINTQPILRNDGNMIVLEISGKNVPATFATLCVDGRNGTFMYLIKQTTNIKSAVKFPKKRRALVDPKKKKKPFEKLLNQVSQYVPWKTSQS